MTTVDYRSALVRESDRFLDTLDTVEPEVMVPSCPAWSAADLLWHLAEVQHFWSVVVAERLRSPEGYRQPARPADHGELRQLFISVHQQLLDALDGADDETPVWTWFTPDQTVGFIRRRQVHEAAIHRLDAQLAAGTVGSFDSDLADDGIDEAIGAMFGVAPSWSTVTTDGPAGTIVAADTGRAWRLQLATWDGTDPETGAEHRAEPIVLTGVAGPSGFEVTGTASDLYAWLWNRPATGTITRSGDHAAFTNRIEAGFS